MLYKEYLLLSNEFNSLIGQHTSTVYIYTFTFIYVQFIRKAKNRFGVVNITVTANTLFLCVSFVEVDNYSSNNFRLITVETKIIEIYVKSYWNRQNHFIGWINDESSQNMEYSFYSKRCVTIIIINKRYRSECDSLSRTLIDKVHLHISIVLCLLIETDTRRRKTPLFIAFILKQKMVGEKSFIIVR